jgi:hypothetical protein
MAQKKKKLDENTCRHTHVEIIPHMKTNPETEAFAFTVDLKEYEDHEIHVGNEFYPEVFLVSSIYFLTRNAKTIYSKMMNNMILQLVHLLSYDLR